MDKSEFIPYLCVFAIALVVVVRQSWRNAGAGLLLAYCYQLFMFHWVGGLIHSLSWSDLPQSDIVLLGLQQSTYGVVAFSIGALAIGPLVAKRLRPRPARPTSVPDERLPRAYITYGMISYFALVPTLGRVSGLTFISSIGSQMIVVGCALNCWKAFSSGGNRALLRAVVPTLLIPIVTVVDQGFLGYGIRALSTIFIFCAQFFRPRWVLIAGFAILGYLGLCLYGGYMRDRGELRAAVWGGQSYTDRVARFAQTLQTLELFSFYNPDHLDLVDGRLNQNILVGAAVDHLSITGDFARGGTLWDATLALIPRLIWPSKPMKAGSGGLATRFTGMEFAANTSVGIGPVLEFYANFEEIGVWVGFLILGAALKVVDSMAGWHLAANNWHGFAALFLVGIGFLNMQGSFVEISVDIVGSLVLARMVNNILKKRRGTSPTSSEGRASRQVEVRAVARN